MSRTPTELGRTTASHVTSFNVPVYPQCIMIVHQRPLQVEPGLGEEASGSTDQNHRPSTVQNPESGTRMGPLG